MPSLTWTVSRVWLSNFTTLDPMTNCAHRVEGKFSFAFGKLFQQVGKPHFLAVRPVDPVRFPPHLNPITNHKNYRCAAHVIACAVTKNLNSSLDLTLGWEFASRLQLGRCAWRNWGLQKMSFCWFCGWTPLRRIRFFSHCGNSNYGAYPQRTTRADKLLLICLPKM